MDAVHIWGGHSVLLRPYMFILNFLPPTPKHTSSPQKMLTIEKTAVILMLKEGMVEKKLM